MMRELLPELNLIPRETFAGGKQEQPARKLAIERAAGLRRDASAGTLASAMRRALVALFLLFAMVYGGDYLLLAYRTHTNRNGLGSVTLQTYYSVKLKSGKTEFDYAGPQNVECVNSLLPHYGDQPCWYARRKNEQQIDIDSGDPHNPKLF
jgi:hypothetical protein